MLNQAQLRMILRWPHIAAGVFLVGYVYKFHLHPGATKFAQSVVVPGIALSGLWLWQQGRVVKWTRRTASRAGAGRP